VEKRSQARARCRHSGAPRRRWRYLQGTRGFVLRVRRRSSAGGGRFGATASVARTVRVRVIQSPPAASQARPGLAFPHINDSRVNSSHAERAADTIAPNGRRRQRSVFPQVIHRLWNTGSTAATGAALRHAAFADDKKPFFPTPMRSSFLYVSVLYFFL